LQTESGEGFDGSSFSRAADSLGQLRWRTFSGGFMNKSVYFVAALGLIGGAISATAITPADVKVKKVIADKMTAAELAAYKERLAERANNGAFDNPRGGLQLTPADLCTGTTPEISALPYNSGADTTTGSVDNYDLPPDTTDPTCTAAATCTGTGGATLPPRGAIYTGTGTGPDRAYQFQVSAACNLTITMVATEDDMALILYQTACSSNLADCACVSDSGFAGDPETITLAAVPGTTYYVVVDGYSTGATPPGPDGPFSFSITGSGCTLTPVDLQSFTVEN
jgi:hypothetical protein